jgi:hypothetical protein
MDEWEMGQIGDLKFELMTGKWWRSFSCPHTVGSAHRPIFPPDKDLMMVGRAHPTMDNQSFPPFLDMSQN